ncbi:hypothetical protein WJX77_001593 [Trebouxia sp. C0004]
MFAVLDMSQNGLYFSKAAATGFQLYTLGFSMMLASNALGTLVCCVTLCCHFKAPSKGSAGKTSAAAKGGKNSGKAAKSSPAKKDTGKGKTAAGKTAAAAKGRKRKAEAQNKC